MDCKMCKRYHEWSGRDLAEQIDAHLMVEKDSGSKTRKLTAVVPTIVAEYDTTRAQRVGTEVRLQVLVEALCCLHDRKIVHH